MLQVPKFVRRINEVTVQLRVAYPQLSDDLNDISVVLAVLYDWWFVPREQNFVKAAKDSLLQDIKLYRTQAIEPQWFTEAAEYLLSEKHKKYKFLSSHPKNLLQTE